MVSFHGKISISSKFFSDFLVNTLFSIGIDKYLKSEIFVD